MSKDNSKERYVVGTVKTIQRREGVIEYMFDEPLKVRYDGTIRTIGGVVISTDKIKEYLNGQQMNKVRIPYSVMASIVLTQLEKRRVKKSLEDQIQDWLNEGQGEDDQEDGRLKPRTTDLSSVPGKRRKID